jgi:hypothetical protein
MTRRLEFGGAVYWRVISLCDRQDARRPHSFTTANPSRGGQDGCGSELPVHLRYPIREIRVISGCFQKTGY